MAEVAMPELIWIAALGFGPTTCLLLYRLAVVTMAYRLAIKTGDLEAIDKVSVLAGALSAGTTVGAARRALPRRKP
jgi:hypothetical protein